MRIQLPPVKPGQEIIRLYRGRQENVQVARVGRKWVWISLYGREYAYDIKTGHSQEIRGDVDRIVTAEMLATEARRRDAMDRIKAGGFEPTLRNRPMVSIETLEAIADLLDGGNEMQEA